MTLSAISTCSGVAGLACQTNHRISRRQWNRQILAPGRRDDGAGLECPEHVDIGTAAPALTPPRGVDVADRIRLGAGRIQIEPRANGIGRAALAAQALADLHPHGALGLVGLPNDSGVAGVLQRGADLLHMPLHAAGDGEAKSHTGVCAVTPLPAFAHTDPAVAPTATTRMFVVVLNTSLPAYLSVVLTALPIAASAVVVLVSCVAHAVSLLAIRASPEVP